MRERTEGPESVGDSCRGVAGSISVDRRHKLFQWTQSSGSIVAIVPSPRLAARLARTCPRHPRRLARSRGSILHRRLSFPSRLSSFALYPDRSIISLHCAFGLASLRRYYTVSSFNSDCYIFPQKYRPSRESRWKKIFFPIQYRVERAKTMQETDVEIKNMLLRFESVFA